MRAKASERSVVVSVSAHTNPKIEPSLRAELSETLSMNAIAAEDRSSISSIYDWLYFLHLH
jgi:hypothetical protein